MVDTSSSSDRRQLEKRIGARLRELSAGADLISHAYANEQGVSTNEFRALLHVSLADASGHYLTAGDLRRRMGMSGAAISYIVEHLVDAGHLRREADPCDRRRIIIRHSTQGAAVARTFFARLTAHNRRSLDGITDEDLATADRVFVALLDGMHAFRADIAVRERH